MKRMELRIAIAAVAPGGTRFGALLLASDVGNISNDEATALVGSPLAVGVITRADREVLDPDLTADVADAMADKVDEKIMVAVGVAVPLAVNCDILTQPGRYVFELHARRYGH